MFCRYFLILLFVVKCQCILYSVNDTEYKRMPPLFAMDDYDNCMLDSDGRYCVAEFELFSRKQSQLMELIKEYSLYSIKHFNHTRIYRAVCLYTTCQNHYKSNESLVLNISLEACINQSIWDEYELEAKISKLNYCKLKDSPIDIDGYDVAVAVIYVLIIVLNVTGSFYDIYQSRRENKTGNAYLLAFSIQRNWAKLIAPSSAGPDPRLRRLKMFHGMRAVTMVGVIFGHACFGCVITFFSNPSYIEKMYEIPLVQLILNGFVIIHSFFLMSSFLLAYNLQIYNEKHKLTWTQIPRGILLRWLRLTPPYALVIASISTWVRHLGSGPMWDLVVTSESRMCREYWWANVFYFNNYIYKQDNCFPQGWYLAADTQLFCIGLTLLVLVKKPRSRKIALSAMFLISLIISAAHTYFENLDGTVLQTPESFRNFYLNNDTWLLVYIRGHTNLATYTMGLAGGLLCYYWHKIDIDLSKFKKYRWVLWLEIPIGMALILTGGFFYIDGKPPSTLVNVIYAIFYKPILMFLILIFMVLNVFKFERISRAVIEWHGFTWAGRVCYSAYLLHCIFQRTYFGGQGSLLYLTHYNMAILAFAFVLMSFLGGVLLWLSVEAPVAALTRVMFTPSKNN